MIDCKGKKLLILGGTRLSCEIVNAAKEMGVYTIVTDYNNIEASPAKQIADESFLVSTTDVDAVAELIRREKIDGVIVGFIDSLMSYYVQICEKTNLPCYANMEQVTLFTDKKKYKKLLQEYGLPTVKEYLYEEVIDGKNNVVYPVLVKPADSSGARGISVCYSAEEVEIAFSKAKSFSKSGTVLLERYIEGDEVTVFWLFNEGEYYLTDIGNRHVKNNQDAVIPLPVGYTYPSYLVPIFRDKYEAKFKKMFHDTGIKNGMMFMQCKVEDDDCIVYDIGYRLTGSLEYKHMEKIYGINPMKMMIHYALTGSMGDDNLSKKINPDHTQKAFNVSILVKPGIIDSVCGCDEAKSIPGVIDVVLAHVAGEEITQEMKGLLAQIGVRVLGVVDNSDELYPTMNRINNTISFLSDKKELLNLPGIEMTDISDVVM